MQELVEGVLWVLPGEDQQAAVALLLKGGDLRPQVLIG